MALRFCSLGSGSEGNALVVESSDQGSPTRIMLDCGFGLSETTMRLARVGLAPSDISAIVVTHEHSDHIGGVSRYARKHQIPVWLTHGTARILPPQALPRELINFVDPHEAFAVGGLEVVPYTVPHDAYEPVQYVFADGSVRLGVLTDVGTVTAHIESSLTACDALVLEANHDTEMLMNGPYPASLKRRVGGRFGHLANEAAAALLRRIDCSKLQHVVAAHLSQRNNRPELARAAFAAALSCEPSSIETACQELGFGWRTVQ